MNELQTPFAYFTDRDGGPLDNGRIWIGEPNQDPEDDPKQVYWNADGTLPADQPIRTLAGMPSRLGTPARLYVDGPASMRVEDSTGRLVYHVGSTRGPLSEGTSIDVRDFDSIQSALDYAATLTPDDWTSPGASRVTVDLAGGSYVLTEPLVFRDQSYSWITLSGGQLVPSAEYLWGVVGDGLPTRYLVEMTGNGVREVHIVDINMPCAKRCNGILFDVADGAFNRVERCTITNFVAYGINIESAAGTFVENNVVTEWLSSDAEFADDDAYVGTACRIGDADQKIFRNVFRWSGCNLRMDAGTAMVCGNHLYNGRFTTPPRYRPCNIEVRGYGNAFVGNYIGNGEIRLYNTNQTFDGNRHSGNAAASTLRAMYCLMAQSVDDKVNALRITNGMLTNEQQEDATGYRYITLVEEDGFNFVDRDSAFLLRDKASNVEVTGGTWIWTRMGLLSRRVGEFRGQMPTALVTAESSTTTSNDALPGFGAFGDYAVISTNNENHVFVSPAGNVGLNATETTYKLGVSGGANTLVRVENTSETGTAAITAIGARNVLTEDIGGVFVNDRSHGAKAAFTGRVDPLATTGGHAVISAAVSSVLAPQWTVTGSQLRPWANNSVDIGTAGYRVKDLYLANSPNVSSDERNKDNILDSDLGLEFIQELRPVRYTVSTSSVAQVAGPSTTETVQVPVTVDESYEEITVVDDEAVLRTRTRRVPVYDALPVVDTDGNPVYETDESGNPTEVQRTYLAPRMQTITRTAPSLVPDETAGARVHYGLIAQEVKQALDTLSVASFAGWGLADPEDEESTQHLRYEEFISPLIKAVQELAERVEALETP